MAQMIKISRGHRLKKKDGKDSCFYVDHRGVLYDDTGPTRKVGLLAQDGSLSISKKYTDKFGERVKQIVFGKEDSQPTKEKETC